MIFLLQFELLVLFDYEDPQWGLTEDDVAELKEIFTLFDTDNVEQSNELMSNENRHCENKKIK